MKTKAEKNRLDTTAVLTDRENMTDIEKESLRLAEIVSATQAEMSEF